MTKWRLLACAAALTLTACDDKGTGPGGRPAAVSINIAWDFAALIAGDSLVLPIDALDSAGVFVPNSLLRWESTASSVASVSSTGRVRAVGVGSTFIFARSGTVRDSIRIVVRPRITITVAPRTDTLDFLGDSTRFTATVGGAPSPVSVYWSSSDTSVAVARTSGWVLGRRPGAAWIHAFDESGARDSARLVVRQVVDSLRIQPASVRLPVERSGTFAVSAVDAGGALFPVPGTVTWSVADPAIATVDQNGTVRFIGVGQTLLQASLEGKIGRATLIADAPPALRFTVDTLFLMEGTAIATTPFVGDGQLRVTSAPAAPAGVSLVALTVLDPSIVSASASVAAAEGTSGLLSDAVGTTALRVGSTTIEARAKGYTLARATVVVVPRTLSFLGVDRMELESALVGVAFTPTVFLGRVIPGTPAGSTTVPLAVTTRSSNRAAFACTPPTSPLPAGTTAFRPSCVAQSAGGSAWLVVSVQGYPSDSILVRLTTQRLRFGVSTLEDLPAAATAVRFYLRTTVMIQPPPLAPTPITITQRHPELLRIDGTREILPVIQYTNLTMMGLAEGVDTVIVSGPALAPDTLVVRISRASFETGLFGDPIPERVAAGSGFDITITARDASGGRPCGDTRPFEITSDPPGLWSPPSKFVEVNLTAPCFNPVTRFPVVAATPGRGVLIVRDTAGIIQEYRSHEIEVFAVPVRIQNVSGNRLSLGFGQQLANIPVSFPGTLKLSSIVSRDPTIASASLLPPAQFQVTGGTRAGTTWIVTGGPGLLSDSIQVDVGKPTISLTGYDRNMPGSGAATVTVTLRDHLGEERVSTDAVTLNVTTSDASVVAPDSAVVKIAAGSSTASFLIRSARAGVAIIHVRDARDTAVAYEPAATVPIKVLSGSP